MGPTAQIAVYFKKSSIWGPLRRLRSILKRIIAINLKIEFIFMFRISILVLVGGTSAALACKEQTSVLVLVGGTSAALACKEQTSVLVLVGGTIGSTSLQGTDFIYIISHNICLLQI
jgi:hypothetical protein